MFEASLHQILRILLKLIFPSLIYLTSRTWIVVFSISLFILFVFIVILFNCRRLPTATDIVYVRYGYCVSCITVFRLMLLNKHAHTHKHTLHCGRQWGCTPNQYQLYAHWLPATYTNTHTHTYAYIYTRNYFSILSAISIKAQRVILLLPSICVYVCVSILMWLVLALRCFGFGCRITWPSFVATLVCNFITFSGLLFHSLCLRTAAADSNANTQCTYIHTYIYGTYIHTYILM